MYSCLLSSHSTCGPHAQSICNYRIFPETIAIKLKVQGAHLSQGTIRPSESLIIGLKYCTKMMSSHNALQRLVHRSKSESAGEEKWSLNTCAFETSTIMINEGSCPKYYFHMMNNCSIWRPERLLIFSLEKRAKRAQILAVV